jgi:hypothetical protein
LLQSELLPSQYEPAHVYIKILHQAFRQIARRVIDGVADGTFIRSSRLRFA